MEIKTSNLILGMKAISLFILILLSGSYVFGGAKVGEELPGVYAISLLDGAVYAEINLFEDGTFVYIFDGSFGYPSKYHGKWKCRNNKLRLNEHGRVFRKTRQCWKDISNSDSLIYLQFYTNHSYPINNLSSLKLLMSDSSVIDFVIVNDNEVVIEKKYVSGLSSLELFDEDLVVKYFEEKGNCLCFYIDSGTRSDNRNFGKFPLRKEGMKVEKGRLIRNNGWEYLKLEKSRWVNPYGVLEYRKSHPCSGE